MKMLTLKRLFDIIFSLLLGVLLLPVILVIVVAIKLTSPGSVLFRQKRLGLNGETFLMGKFRKFPSDWGSKGPSVTLQYDTRMTKVGRFLERTKLDEIPQLWNILIGDMSFVGPRPETTNWAHLFKGSFSRIFDFKPGIFGPNQTKYRNESAMYPDGVDPEQFYETVLFPDKAKRDLEYCERANILTDLKCIVSGSVALIFSSIIFRRSSKTTLVIGLYDVLAVLIGWSLAHYLKFGTQFERLSDQKLYLLGMVLLPLITVVVFFISSVYKNPPRYFSETDFYRLASSACVMWISAAIVFGLTLKSTSSMLLAVSCLISIMLMTIPRVAYKIFWKKQPVRHLGKNSSRKVNTIVCGISNQSVELSRLLSLGFPRAKVLGLVEEGRDLVHREIYGFEILGNYGDLEMLHSKHCLHHVWISSEVSESSHQLIQNWCAKNTVVCTALKDEIPFKNLLNNQSPSTQVRLPRAATPRDVRENSKTDEAASAIVG